MKKRYLSIYLVLILFTSKNIVFAANYEDNISPVKLFLKFVFYLIVFVFILILAFYGTKLYAKKTKSLFKSKYIKILDTISLDRNIKIIVAKISGNIYILSITNNNVDVIDKIKEKEFYLNKNDEFEDYLDEFTNESSEYQLKNIELRAKNIFSRFANKFNLSNKEDEENEKDL